MTAKDTITVVALVAVVVLGFGINTRRRVRGSMNAASAACNGQVTTHEPVTDSAGRPVSSTDTPRCASGEAGAGLSWLLFFIVLCCLILIADIL